MQAEQLELLALISRYGSMAAAAGHLGRTPAAITHQLARAELELGTPLVIRGPRGATLTPAGSLLAQHGTAISTELAKAQEGLSGLLGRFSRRLRIGAFQAAALHLLPPALTALRHRHPEAELIVQDSRSEHGIEEVAAGRLDLAIIASWDTPPDPPDQVRAHLLLQDPMVVVLPDDHPALGHPEIDRPAIDRPAPDRPAGSGSIDLRQLAGESWVTILAGHAARAQFDRLTQDAGFTPRIRFLTESYDVAQAFVGTGIGVALVSRLALRQTPRTTYRELRAPAPSRQLYAIAAADSTATPLVPEFLRLLLDVSADISAAWPPADPAPPRDIRPRRPARPARAQP